VVAVAHKGSEDACAAFVVRDIIRDEVASSHGYRVTIPTYWGTSPWSQRARSRAWRRMIERHEHR
jgi:hypothetical protein